MNNIVRKMRVYAAAVFYVVSLFFNIYGAFGLGIGILDGEEDGNI